MQSAQGRDHQVDVSAIRTLHGLYVLCFILDNAYVIEIPAKYRVGWKVDLAR